eukprot:m.575688 g.575688  ORF g.575688 m.575688 type:complete len:102 (-) comp22285_c0_seq7:10-315(-)
MDDTVGAVFDNRLPCHDFGRVDADNAEVVHGATLAAAASLLCELRGSTVAQESMPDALSMQTDTGQESRQMWWDMFSSVFQNEVFAQDLNKKRNYCEWNRQ